MGKYQDLLEASRNGNVPLVGKILHSISKRSGPLSGFRKSRGINVQDMNGYTPLHHASLNNHGNIVHLLLANGADPEIPDIRGSTPLYLAAWAGHNDIAKMLLMNSSVNPNVQTSDNETPLHCAAQHGHNTVLATLLAYGADPTIRSNSFQTPLDLACQFGRLQVVNILLRTHPELIQHFNASNLSLKTKGTISKSTSNQFSEMNGFLTPKHHILTHSCLHLASRNGHKKVVEALLAAGIDVNILTPSGTALHEAALCGKQSVVKILLNAGVDPNAVDSKGRSVLDVLQDYPPHVTYEISCLIKEFCNLMKSDKHFRPIIEADLKPKEFNKISTSDKFHSLPRTKFEVRQAIMDRKELLNDDSSSDNGKSPILTNSLSSLKNTAGTKVSPKRASYVPMKPIIKEGHSSDKSNEKLNSFQLDYSKTFMASTEERKTLENPSRHQICSSPYEMMCLATSPKRNSSSTTTNSITPADEYGDVNSTPTPTRKPTPLSNDYDFNVNLSDDMKFQTKEKEFPAIKRILSLDANNNKEHSPTPDFPPPSVSAAEKAIFEFMCPQNDKEKRRSLRINNEDLRELENFFLDKANISEAEENSSDHVSEYVSDTPFAGLFKGSTLNLVNGDDEFLSDRDALRSPSLVKSVLPVPPKRTSSCRLSTLKDSKEFSASTIWKEIDDIFERIEKQVDDEFENSKHVESIDTNYEEDEGKSKTNTLSIRKPKELLFKNSEGVATNWCHSPEALLYDQVEYKVYYLGSTVIRNLQGTASTRLSIQKLKIDENELEQEADADLLKDCTKSTKYLKSNNLQTRLSVGITISYLGVKFIDNETENMICLHSVANINCVCQDAEDLRYFAYITKENDVHYCHVFMVDDLDLAKEIILTLGQAFEVAYQVMSTEDSELPVPLAET